MTDEKKIARASSESPQFGRYAEYMLEEIPGMSFPILRECFKHNAAAREYLSSVKKWRPRAMTTIEAWSANDLGVTLK